MSRSRLIVGVAGTTLASDEAAFFRDIRPIGLILFSRNLQSHDQIRGLIDSAKSACIGEDLLVLIDQEGGRVQRLRPPLGRVLPPASVFGDLYDREPEAACEAARAVARLLASDMLAIGINTVCAPVLDVPVPGAHDVIGDRAYGAEPTRVAALGLAVADGLMDGGVLPVMKHIPGHGRAGSDSHFDLPVVTATRERLSASDFAPFRAAAGLPAAMTAHVVFTAIDAAKPASTSRAVISDVIRGEIGFDGLLMSDDLSMRALSGDMQSRAKAVLDAGSDVALHCNGLMTEMKAAASVTPNLDGESLRRVDAAFDMIRKGASAFDEAAAEASLAALVSS